MISAQRDPDLGVDVVRVRIEVDRLVKGAGRRSIESRQIAHALALSLPMQRNLMAIALEALGNAARHAKPTRIELGIQPGQRGWLMWVEDDGLGLAACANPGTGMGLDNMRRRAQEIGGEIEIGPGSGNNGTRVQTSFDPSR